MLEPLTSESIRVLGVLIEKELTTPDYYPMTVNALTNGCNQKSNREPVVAYDEADISNALAELARRHLVGRASGAGSRAIKYRHALAEQLRLNREQRAVLATLMLRGPQTIGEIRNRTERMVPLPDLESVQAILESLHATDDPLVRELPVQPGQKEARVAHLLSGDSLDPLPEQEHGNSPAVDAASVQATAPTTVRQEVADLRERLEALEAAFAKFRRQFE